MTDAGTAPSGDAEERRRLAARARAALALSDEALLCECSVDVFVASGPGGQHRNKTESGVRLRHWPTGVLVTATERRSQFENRHRALERLRGELERLAHVPRARKASRPTRGSVRRRLESKSRRSALKAGRRSSDDDA